MKMGKLLALHLTISSSFFGLPWYGIKVRSIANSRPETERIVFAIKESHSLFFLSDI